MRILVLVASLVAALPVAAQQPQAEPAHVPIEFVRRLSASPLGSVEEIRVGRFADDMKSIIGEVETFRIVGSLTFGERFTMNAAVAAGSVTDVMQSFTDRMASRGWSHLPEQPGVAGFLSDPPGGRGSVAANFCDPQGQTTLLLITRPRDADSANVDIISIMGPGTPCFTSRGARDRAPTGPPVPGLSAPEGSVVAQQSSHGSAHDAVVSAQLRTTLTVADVAAHYAAAMRTESWSPGESLVGHDAALLLFRKQDDAGRAWHSSLTIHGDAGTIELRLHLWSGQS